MENKIYEFATELGMSPEEARKYAKNEKEALEKTLKAIIIAKEGLKQETTRRERVEKSEKFYRSRRNV